MLNRRNVIASSALLFLSGEALSATQVAPSNRVNLFLDTTTPFGSADWTNGTSTTIGAVKVLKSTGNTEFHLKLNIPNLGFVGAGKIMTLDAVNQLGGSHARISETGLYNSYPGQCVAFAKSMIGSSSPTSTWHTGTKLANIAVNQRAAMLPAGTMIAYFNGKSVYPANGTGHVAIVLGVAADGSGLWVVDENFINGFSIKVGTTSYAASTATHLIGKHLMPWTDTSARRAAGQYHIVDLY
jgi:hypothetical protein